MRITNWQFLAGVLLTPLLLAPTVSAQRPAGKPVPGEKNTPPARGERLVTSLKPGDAAPDFTLPTLKGDQKVRLSDSKGKKPVVLIFGSYT
jgi:hypothetical protein